ncbi:MAG: DUF4465 domain-containing protein [Paludibacteraceae bacterium]
MKKTNLFLIIAVVAVFLASCKPETDIKTTIVDFEDVTLTEAGVSNATFNTQGIQFLRNGANSWDGGFTASNLTDTTTVEYSNDNSSAFGKGALNSTKYAVGYVALFTNGLDTINLPANEYGKFKAKSVMLTNTTIAYRSIKYGENAFPGPKKFVEGDWFKITISGFVNKAKTSEIDYYLADFRNGKSFVAGEWQKVNISDLGEIDQLVFTVSSSDTGDYGMNTPSYFCIDNLELTQEVNE